MFTRPGRHLRAMGISPRGLRDGGGQLRGMLSHPGSTELGDAERCKGLPQYMGVSENNVPLHPMVLLIIIPTKWL